MEQKTLFNQVMETLENHPMSKAQAAKEIGISVITLRRVFSSKGLDFQSELKIKNWIKKKSNNAME